jgi:hypothetical protein
MNILLHFLVLQKENAVRAHKVSQRSQIETSGTCCDKIVARLNHARTQSLRRGENTGAIGAARLSDGVAIHAGSCDAED